MKFKTDRKYTRIATYVVVCAFIIMCLSKVIDNISDISNVVMDGIGWVLKVLRPVLYGFIIAYLFNPINNFFEKLYRGRRGLAVLTTLLLTILAITAVISVIVFSVTNQLKVANLEDFVLVISNFRDTIEEYYNTLLRWLEEYNFQSKEVTDAFKDASDQILSVVTGLFGGVLSGVTSVSDRVTTIVFSVIIGVYFMLDVKVVSGLLDRVTKACLSDKANAKIRELLADLNQACAGYIKGQGMDVLVMMALISISLSICGVKFSVVIGFLAGLFNLIPYCGPILAYGLTAIVCLVNGEIKKMVIAIIVLIVIQVLDGNLIGPRLLSKSIDVHPLMVIIALIIASAIGGVAGMILAVPIAGFVKIEFQKWLHDKEEKRGLVLAAAGGDEAEVNVKADIEDEQGENSSDGSLKK